MAIEKIESKKYEFTKESILQLGIAAALAAVSIPLAWFAFSNWKFKSSLIAGYQAYEGNRVGEAKRELEDALSWKPEHVGARGVLAKILCDAGGSQLDQAEGHYRKIRELGGDSETVKIGMGVIALKRAELAAATKDVQALVTKAETEFRGALGIPEGNIGLGHCTLLLAHKLNNPKLLDDARTKFESIRKEMGNKATASRISRDGLIDYYSGVGRALATGGPKDLEAARDAFQSCMQLSRRWESPRASMMAVEARQWAVWQGTLGEITALEPATAARRKALGSYWRDSRDKALYEKHARPWMMLSIAFAQALARAGNDRAAAPIFTEVRTHEHLKEFLEPAFADARYRGDVAMKEGVKPSEQETAAREAITPLDALAKKLAPVDEAAKDQKARALNNLAVMRFLLGSSGHRQAAEALREALKLFPDDYVYHRNLVVVLKRSKAPAAELQAAVEKAKTLAAGPYADDFAKVQKVLEEK